MFKVQTRKPCAKRRAALCGHYPAARGREAVVHLLSTATGVQLLRAQSLADFMMVAAGRRGQETHQTKPRKEM